MNERSFIVKSPGLAYLGDFIIPPWRGFPLPLSGEKTHLPCFSRPRVQIRFQGVLRHDGRGIRVQCRAIDRRLTRLRNELPDCNNSTQDAHRVSDSFHDTPALLFRPNEECVCRFMSIVHKYADPPFFDEDVAGFSFCLNAGDRSSLTFERWMQPPDGLDSNQDNFVSPVLAGGAPSHWRFRRTRFRHVAASTGQSWL
jgi:hypothetical protein